MKILLIRLSSMGDVVLTTSVISAIRKKHPDAQIDFVVKEQFAPLIQYHPAINRLYTFGKKPGALKELKRQIITSGYDILLDLHNTFRSNYLKWNCGVPVIQTLSKEYLRRFLLVKLKINRYRNSETSIIDRYAQAACNYLDLPVAHFPEIYLPEQIEKNASDLLPETTMPTIVLVPGSAHPTKEWPISRFTEAASLLSCKFGARIVVIGGKKEIPAGKMISQSVGAQCYDFTGKTTLLETAAIIKKCDLIISVDTGCMHIGWAFHRKMVCIFGSTVRELGYYPDYSDAVIVENEELTCRPCSHNGLKSCPKNHFRCMKEISTGMVMKVAEKLLNQ
jgi:heptosyltransferase-2